MMKMKVQLNEKKIEKNSEYTVDEINNMVIKVAQDRGITKITEKGLFIGNDDNNDFSNFGLIVLYLAKQNWFLPYVKNWILYAEEETDDLAKYFREYNKQRMANV